MHRLDGHINDLEPRIRAIYKYASMQEEVSLQESLSSYGWILLDSWVAWRTLRFLLREANIDEKVNDKWFQTPGSYNASQLRAVWKFEEKTLEYIEKQTGKGFRNLIDNTIQTKRNASAHFTKKTEIKGADSQDIRKIFEVMSNVFRLYENYNFWICMCEKMEKRGYTDFRVIFSNGNVCSMNNLLDSIEDYMNSDSYQIAFENHADSYKIKVTFNKCGCFVEAYKKGQKCDAVDVINNQYSSYNVLGNKGFYQNIDLFIDTLCDCIKKNVGKFAGIA